MLSLYRLQINQEYTFDQAIQDLDYLQDLGMDGVYCSPIYEAISEHGYDITDPNKPNPLFGDFKRFCDSIHLRGMKIVIDVVPNHMGFVNGKNRFFEDVLEKGQASIYAHFFDIDWDGGKVILPILEEEKVIEKGYGHYVHWKRAATDLNYRRFFNIQELIGLAIEHPDVLELHHKWIFEMMLSGQIDGLRIDHPDGLLDPATYFHRLRQKKKLFTVVEKILEPDEELPNWECEGTVGYEYLNWLNGLFVQTENEEAFTKIYEKIAGRIDFHETLLKAKRSFAQNYMMSEINRLHKLLPSTSCEALIELIASFPVYRTYVIDKPSVQDERMIGLALAKAKRNRPDLDFSQLERELFKKPFALKFQQVTGPMMAKGLEDTTFYRYNRFISLNEVGGDPSYFGHSKARFHSEMKRKLKKWPLGLLATSTHDTKRSEDARMRLNVISELPAEWEELVDSWQLLDHSIDGNMAYHIYQTIIAGWPRGGPQWPHFFERIWSVVLKSIREAKEFTDWIKPNLEYEKRVHNFLKQLLTPGSPFLRSLIPFIEKIEPFAEKSTLSALAIKVASPGVVDTYQGNETWCHRLVDPDNRLPFAPSMGSSKQYFLRTLLHFRKEHPQLFLEGEYIPLESASATIAFIRRTKEEELLVIAGRFFASSPDFGYLDYTGELLDLFAKKEIYANKRIDVEEVLGGGPATYLYVRNQEAEVRAQARSQHSR